MANQESRVGSRWKWMTPYELAPFTYIAPNRIRYDGETQGHWDVSAETIVARAVPIPAPAAETPAVCQACADMRPCDRPCALHEIIANKACGCPSGDDCLWDCPKAPPAHPPPRCAPGCTPARACYTPSVCPAFEERRLAGYNYGHGNDDTEVPKGVTSDIPPARESRIGALSWGSSAAVFGGWNGRVPR